MQRPATFRPRYYQFIAHLTVKSPVYRLLSVNSVPKNNTSSKRLDHVFGFGVVATGALGIKRFILPNKSDWRPRHAIYNATPLKFFSEKALYVKSASCGFGYTIFIGDHPTVKRAAYGCGLNTDGQLGYQPTRLRGEISDNLQIDIVPEPQIIDLPYVDKVMPFTASCGRAHSLIACQAADPEIHFLFSLGNNTFGQCAREIIEGEIFTSEHSQITRVNLPEGLKYIKQVICGQDHSLVLSEDGSLYSAGLGNDGQTGLGNTDCTDQLKRVRGGIDNLKVELVSSRGDTVLAVTNCGRLFAWGNNEYGQIWTMPDHVQVLEPVELPFRECVDLQDKAVSIGAISRVASAGSACAILDEHGQVFIWGFGCLGLGLNVHQALKPTLIPPALFLPAQPFSGSNQIIDVVPGLHHFVARSRSGLLWSWGAPRGGLAPLGIGPAAVAKPRDRVARHAQTYPVPVPLSAEATDVACGVDHTVVLAKSFA